MAWKSKAFAALVVAGGGLALAELPGYWQSDDLLRFAVFTLLAIFTASWNVTLPGAKGPMSANFLFVLVAAAQLGEGETLALAALAVVAHSWLHPSGKGWHRFGQTLFDAGSMAIAVRITTLAYHIVLPRFPAVELPLRLALTASAYFVFSTMPFSILESLRERKPLVRAWAQRFLWAFPYHLTGATVSGLLWAVKTALGWQASTLVVPALYLVYRWYAVYLESVERERNEAEELAALHLRTIEALALAIEAKDQAGYNQLQRVQLFCMEIGRELGMDAQELQALLAASLLRDIGKLAVPEHISSKPGALTPEEFEKVKIHPVVGAEILERVRFPYPVVPIVRHHHERWDGGGYPDGIRAEEIPLGARILSVVDCFDALSSDRLYRSAMPVEESIAYIRQEAGKAFDPRVVEVLGRRYEELEREARSRQREEQATEVRSQSEQAEFVQSIAAARAEAQFLFSISQDLTLSIDLEAMLTKLSERLPQAVPFDTLVYYHLDGESLYPLFVNGWERTRFEQLRVPLGQGLSGWAVKEKRTICNGNPAAELGPVGDPAAFTNLRSALVVPVEGAAGVSGALMLCSLNRERYSRDQVRILMAVAARLAFQVENSLRYRKASGDAFTDELTGLHNSRWLVSALRNACRAAARDNEPFLVLVMDLDGFKSLNDTFGHLTGNEALRGIAAGAQRLIPAPGSFSRMGGDEFVAVLPGVTWDGAIALAEKIQAVTEEVGLGLVGDGRLSCSWGLSAYGQDGVSPEALMAEADHRMYAYKRTKQERMAARLSRLAASIDGEEAASEKPIALRDET